MVGVYWDFENIHASLFERAHGRDSWWEQRNYRAEWLVDVKAVMGFVKIAGTEFSLAHVLLSKDGTGSHTLTASDRVGISVYGIQDFGSYWVVGGLDLDHI